MARVRISRIVPRAIPFRWWQAGRVAPVDCSTFTCEVAETTLPFIPAIAPVDPALGKFSWAPATLQQLAQLRPGKTYGMHVVLKNAAGDAIEEFHCTFEAA